MSDRYSQKQVYSNTTRAVTSSYLPRHGQDELISSNYQHQINALPMSSANYRTNFTIPIHNRPPPPVMLNLYQNNLPSRTPVRGYKTISKTSSSMNDKIESSTEDLKVSAYKVLSTNVDKNLQIMTKGIELQRKAWGEQPEFKQFYSNMIELIQLLNVLRISDKNCQQSIMETIYSLLVNNLPSSLDQLEHVNDKFLKNSTSCKKDIKFFMDEISQKQAINESLRLSDYNDAENEFRKAKKRRNCLCELENLASEVLTKKPRTIYEREANLESIKLEASREEIQKWKKITEIRQLQKESILYFVRELISSIDKSTELINIVQTVNENIET